MKAYRIALPYLAMMAVGCGDDNASTDMNNPSADMAAQVHDIAMAPAGDMAVIADLTPPPTPQKLKETDLVRDQPDAGASTVDPNLLNPWGIAINPGGPIWVSDNHSGLATVYSAAGAIMGLVVTIPPAANGMPPSAPTGQVFNGNGGFSGDKFILSSEDGTITGWQAGTVAVLRVDNSKGGAIYKGLALATQAGATRIYATDFHNGKVDTYDGTYTAVTLTNGFVDANIPMGFAPFGIQAVGATLYVTYAKQDDMAHDDSPGAGNGYVDLFDFDGKLLKSLISKGALNSPWAVAVAPADFGTISKALLVGNFGDGRVNAYDATTGAFLSTVQNAAGAPLVIEGLWALVFGNDTAGEAHNQVFFTAGPGGESHGVLGRLDLAP